MTAEETLRAIILSGSSENNIQYIKEYAKREIEKDRERVMKTFSGATAYIKDDIRDLPIILD